MKKFILLWGILFIGIAGHSQSIYSFEFLNAENTKTNALAVLQPDGTGFVRYFTNDFIAEQKLVESMEATASTGGPEDSLLYEPVSASLVKGNTELVPFQLVLKPAGNEWAPATLLLGAGAKKESRQLEKLAFLEHAQLSKAMLLQYFLPTDAFYRQMFSNNSKALTALEKNTRIHLIIIANTNDSTVGIAAIKDMKTVEEFFSDLTEVMGIRQMNTVKISGNNFSKINVLNTLKKLAPQPNDIVVFYYSGHGFRTRSKPTAYPMYDLRSKPTQDYLKESLTTDTVYKLIRDKNARMTLVLSDCCNWNPDMPLPYVPADPQTRNTNIPWDIEKCRALFLNPKRTGIIGVAADKNQLAVSNAQQGSFFFKYFRESMITVINKTYRSFNAFMDWNYIAESTKTQTVRKAKRTYCSKPYIPTNICNQTPRFLIQ